MDAVATEQQLTDPLPIDPVAVRIVTAASGDSTDEEQAFSKRLSVARANVLSMFERAHPALTMALLPGPVGAR